MIYLDYAANTPVDEEVLNTFCEVSLQYIANPNSPYERGKLAKARLERDTMQIAELLGVEASEIIFTSGATESNNLAIKGIAGQYKKYGRHMITTYLEHSSVNGAMVALQDTGYEVDYVDINEDGLVDLQHMKELIREDTILVSVCLADSEMGIQQQADKIGELISNYPHCFFHVDATQAVGKIPVSLDSADLISFASHKFYGLNGCGVLIKKEGVLLQPQIHGGISTTPFRSGTPALSLIAATAKAFVLSVSEMDVRYKYVAALNKQLKEAFQRYPKVRINSTVHSIPHILNISIAGAKAEQFQAELEAADIFVATKSACCAPNTVSRPVYALTKDKKAALSTMRISLSHLTTEADINTFLECFDMIYRKLVK